MASTNNINLSNSDVNRLIIGRKRKINMENWKNVKNKNLRNSGKEYTSRSKMLVPAKTPPTVVSKNIAILCRKIYVMLKNIFRKKPSFFKF